MTIARIVGETRGIGRDFAIQYLDAGWTVHCTVRDRSQAGALAERGATVHVLDVREPMNRALKVRRERRAGQAETNFFNSVA